MRIIKYLIGLCITFSLYSIDEKTAPTKSEQATFGGSKKDSPGCEIWDKGIWLQANGYMHGAVIIENKSTQPLLLSNLKPARRSKKLNPNEELKIKYGFRPYGWKILVHKYDPTKKKWVLPKDKGEITNNLLWIKKCKVNYASSGAAGTGGYTKLGTMHNIANVTEKKSSDNRKKQATFYDDEGYYGNSRGCELRINQGKKTKRYYGVLWLKARKSMSGSVKIRNVGKSKLKMQNVYNKKEHILKPNDEETFKFRGGTSQIRFWKEVKDKKGKNQWKSIRTNNDLNNYVWVRNCVVNKAYSGSLSAGGSNALSTWPGSI